MVCRNCLVLLALLSVPRIAWGGAAPPVPPARPTLVLQSGHSGEIRHMVFSPDGKTLATAGDDCQVLLWDLPSRRTRAVLPGNGAWVSDFRFSPDSRSLVTADGSGSVCTWDARTGIRRAHWRAPGQHEFAEAHLSADGETALVYRGFEPVFWVLRTHSQRDRRAVRLPRAPGPARGTRTLALSADGELAASAEGSAVRLWDARTGKLRSPLQGPLGRIEVVGFGPTSRLLAAGGSGIALWDAQRGALRAVLQEPGRVQYLAFSPDGRTLASLHAKEERTADRWAGWTEVRLWHTEAGRLLLPARAPLHRERLAWPSSFAVFSSDGHEVVTGPDPAETWDVATGRLSTTPSASGTHGDEVAAVAYAQNGKTIALARGGAVSLLAAADGRTMALLRGSYSPTYRLTYSPDGRALASWGESAPARLWDTSTGELRATLLAMGTGLESLVFDPAGASVAAVCAGEGVRAWAVASGRPRWQVAHDDRDMVQISGGFRLAFAYSADGALLAWGDTGLRVWGTEEEVMRSRLAPQGAVVLRDSATGRLRTTLRGHPGAVWLVAFSRDGRTLVVGYRGLGEAGVWFWDVARGERRGAVSCGKGFDHPYLLSPDGTMLAVAGEKEGRLYEVPGGKLLRELRGAGWSQPVAFSPDGSRLAAHSPAGIHVWDVRTGSPVGKVPYWKDYGQKVALTAGGDFLAFAGELGRVRLFRVSSGQEVRVTTRAQLRGLPLEFTRAVSWAGASVNVHDPRDGRVVATMLPLPEEGAASAAEPGGERPRGGREGWFTTTPEGYFDCSADAARFVTWNVNGALVPAERYLRRFRRPDLVRKALRCEPLAAPSMTAADVPPVARFVGLRSGDAVQGDPLTVNVQATGARPIKEVELFVNGRPISAGLCRALLVGSKALPVASKRLNARSLPAASKGLRAKPLATASKGAFRAQRFAYRVPVPAGTTEVRLRAVAYNSMDIGSDPVEIVLRHAGVAPVTGDLFALSVGVGRYRNAARQGFKDLRFAAGDAQAIAERFRQEGKPLYERVHVRTLADDEATLANLRGGLRWLQGSVRPRQIDTVVLFLSGHGVSRDGRYFFAPHDVDVSALGKTGLSGAELARGLGARLRAKAVFLFVDTCHAGGLPGRNDDLKHALEESGVYLMASSASNQDSYESDEWGHGAFTLSLLRALDNQQLARDGVIHFNGLTYAVPDEVAELMRKAGRGETEQQPCVPLASRLLRMPIAQVRGS